MTPAETQVGQPLTVASSESFSNWLANLGQSIILTTYQANKVIVLGHDGRQLSVLPRNFDKPMGIHVQGGRIALATRHDVVIFADAPVLARHYLESHPGRYDALYLPRLTYHTGDLHLHDLAFGTRDLWLVNTRYCCLCKVSDQFNFVPVWKPRFLSEIAPEDRCHLNGLALVDGEPRFVTALGETDSAGAWRAGKVGGGVVVDISTDSVVCQGLAMPHSPRWHAGRLWVLNSGTGELGFVDFASASFQPVCALPGYLRGLTFVGNHALVGMCTIREKHLFGGMPVQQRFPKLSCGIALVNLSTGQPDGIFEFTAGVTELFDIQMIPHARRPMILNLERESARQAFTAPDLHYWLRPSNEVPSA